MKLVGRIVLRLAGDKCQEIQRHRVIWDEEETPEEDRPTTEPISVQTSP